jgi:DNA repair protein RadD
VAEGPSSVILRDYQLSAVESLFAHWEAKPRAGAAIVIPTGGGKTPVIAAVCLRKMSAGRRGMVLAHRKELIQQTATRIEKNAAALGGGFTPGIYSASLGRRDNAGPVIVGQIQSVANKARLFGALDYMLIDEAHLIAPSGDGRFRTFIAEAREINPELLIAGLTATPYRTTSGRLCGPNEILQTIVHESGIVALMEAGYLCRLVTKQALADVDTSGLHILAGEYKADEAAAMMDTSERVRLACKEAVGLAEGRRSCLVFCCTVHHCQMVAAELRRLTGGPGDLVEVVTGETPSQSRDDIIAGFNCGAVRWLVNCDVLTTGFDSPRVDCVVLFRPTASEGLYYQMTGRGFRPLEGKADCAILDFGGNIKRHGRLDLLEGDKGKGSIKTCPHCRTVAAPGDLACTMCGYEFPKRESGGNGAERKLSHGVEAEAAPIVGGADQGEKAAWLKVNSVRYFLNAGRDGKPDTMRAEYSCTIPGGGWRVVKEWVCFEHGGRARETAKRWWRERWGGSSDYPDTCREAVGVITEPQWSILLRTPTEIQVSRKPGKDFETIKPRFAREPDELERRLVASRAGEPEYGEWC